MNQFFDTILNAIDFVIVALVLVSGFFQARYLKGFSLSKNESYDSALKTLMMSAIFSTVYILLIKDPEKASNWAKYFLSYVFSTSLYELLIQPFTRWLKNQLANKTERQ
jgi:hypothetical protein